MQVCGLVFAESQSQASKIQNLFKMDAEESTNITNTSLANSPVDGPRLAAPRQELPSGGAVTTTMPARTTGGVAVSNMTTTATMLVTQQTTEAGNNAPVLRLSLRPRTNVSWDQSVVDNEGLGKKSSKRCASFPSNRLIHFLPPANPSILGVAYFTNKKHSASHPRSPQKMRKMVAHPPLRAGEAVCRRNDRWHAKKKARTPRFQIISDFMLN